jgi:hypothetical protein
VISPLLLAWRRLNRGGHLQRRRSLYFDFREDLPKRFERFRVVMGGAFQGLEKFDIPGPQQDQVVSIGLIV